MADILQDFPIKACAAVALACLAIRPATAQSPAADSTAAAALIACGVREATARGFNVVPNTRTATKAALMHSNVTPGPRYPLDALGLSIRPDSAGTAALQVRVGQFMVSRTTLAQDEVPPRPSLVALGDSLKARCNPPRNSP